MAGKPVYDKALFKVICDRMAAGESLRSVCRDEGMPAPSTVRLWVLQDQSLAEQYARARESLYEHWADELLEISDDGSNDYMERLTKNGDTETVVNNEHINRSRLRVDSRKWLLSKLLPKKYGDKASVELTGKDGGPVQTETTISVVQSIMAEIDGSTAHVQLPE